MILLFKDYNENIKNYLMVSSRLRDLKKTIPIDLIIHTKPMHDAFISMGSMFSREVMQKGDVLYEKTSAIPHAGHLDQ
jgi:uncharacterized protein